MHSELLIDSVEESFLISAYDIHHDLLADSSAFRYGFKDSRYSKPKPRLLFIDSGGYEKEGSSPDKQFGENQYESLEWEKAEYRRTIENLDEDIRPIVVSWDNCGSYTEQIASGQAFFGDRNSIASTMLLKPPRDYGMHDLGALSGEDFANLGDFDIIGITEKEIGESVLERLVNIAQLRQRLNEAEVKAPIHIFGGLDTLYTPLYFAAGGELFDGLGWLRYVYREGVAMHRDSAALLDNEINRPRIPALQSVCLQNLAELRRLSDDLRSFAREDCNWDRISRGDVLEPIFQALQENLGA